MKRVEPMRLDEIVRYMIEQSGLRPQFERRTIESVWPKVVGKHIASYTGRIYVRDTTLYVHIVSAPLKQELAFLQDNLVQQLNEAAGANVINKIKLL